MPTKKLPCPTCAGLMSAKASRCRKCKPTYERTPENREAMSASLKGKPKPHLKGRKRPEHAAKMKAVWSDPAMREAAKERGDRLAADPAWRQMIADKLSGENNPRWLGGVSVQGYAPGFSRYLKRKIRRRDRHVCQLCGVTEAELGYGLSIHHADYDKTNHHESNLFSACKGCNSRVNTNRNIWIGYFVALDACRQLGQDVSQLIGRNVVTQCEGFAFVCGEGCPDMRGTVFESVIADIAGVT